MNKKVEAEIVKQAVKALLKADPTMIELDKDALQCVADRLGVPRSTLGVWTCARARTFLSTEGLRLLAQHLQAAGDAEAARELVAKIVSNPLGMRLDK